MFIDTYTAFKYARRENITIFPEQISLLNEIDEKQGIREVLKFSKAYSPYDRNSAWRYLQIDHPRLIVIEKSMNNYVNYRFILEEKLQKEIKNYDVFVINYQQDGLMEKPETHYLREAIREGNKLVIDGVFKG